MFKFHYFFSEIFLELKMATLLGKNTFVHMFDFFHSAAINSGVYCMVWTAACSCKLVSRLL